MYCRSKACIDDLFFQPRIYVCGTFSPAGAVVSSCSFLTAATQCSFLLVINAHGRGLVYCSLQRIFPMFCCIVSFHSARFLLPLCAYCTFLSKHAVLLPYRCCRTGVTILNGAPRAVFDASLCAIVHSTNKTRRFCALTSTVYVFCVCAVSRSML